MSTAGNQATTERFSAAQLRGANLFWLLDLTWAGRVFRLSSQEIAVTSTVDGALSYVGDLAEDVAWTDAVSLFAGGGEPRSLPIRFTLPVNIPQWVQEGHDLAQATGQLSRWIEGTTYETRMIVLDGRLVDPEYGAADEPVSASLESNPYDDRALLPTADQVVTAATWPTAVTLGASYPFVFGRFNDSYTSHAPAYYVSTSDQVLIAGHKVAAATVEIGDGDNVDTFAVVTGLDSLGQVVSTVDITGAASIVVGSGAEYWTIFYGGASDGLGGAMRLDNAGAIDGAGDLLQVLLSKSTKKWDRGRTAAAVPFLNRFRVAGYIGESVSPWAYIQANLLKILPVSIVEGTDGLYPLVWRYDAVAGDAVDRFDTGADPSIERASSVSYVGTNDVVNEFKLSYAPRGRHGDFKKTVTLGAVQGNASVYTRISQARYGRRSEDNETICVYADATAALIVTWWARAKSLPARMVSYTTGHDRRWLERGNIVLLTDAELAFTDELAMILDIEDREDGTLTFSFRIQDDPAHQFKRAAE